MIDLDDSIPPATAEEREAAKAKITKAGQEFASLIRNTDCQINGYKDSSEAAQKAQDKITEAIMWARRGLGDYENPF